MTFSAIGLVVALAFAAPADAPISIHMWAVDAADENREASYFERGVEEIRSAVADLPFDTYREVETSWLAAKINEETSFRINEKYTLIVIPRSREDDGRVRLDLRVIMAPSSPGAPPVKALETRVLAIPDKHITLRGLKLSSGHDLLLILSAEQ